MQNFKEYLLETKKTPFAPWQPQDKETTFYALAKMLNKAPLIMSNVEYRINKSGSITMTNDSISGWKFPPNAIIETPTGYGFGMKWQSVQAKGAILQSGIITDLQGIAQTFYGDFEIVSDSIQTFKNFHSDITNQFKIFCPKVNDLADCQIKCSSLSLKDIGFLNVKDLADHIKVDWYIEFYEHFFNVLKNKGLLGLLKFDFKGSHHQNSKRFGVLGDINLTGKYGQIIKIINANREDLLDCQEELISQGYKDYAKL